MDCLAASCTAADVLSEIPIPSLIILAPIHLLISFQSIFETPHENLQDSFGGS